MQKIVFVTGTIRSDTAWPYLFPKGLSEHGLDVTVISGYACINVAEKEWQRQTACPKEEISPHFRIIRVGSKKKEKPSLLFRGVRYLRLTFALSREVKKHRADCYLFYSTPPFLGWIGAKAAKKGKKTVYVAQDLFPDNLFAAKPALDGTPIGKILRRFERRIYNGNTKITTVSRTMKEQIEKEKTKGDAVEVIYNWADTSKLHRVEREKNGLFDEYGVSREKFIVSYAGNLGLLQNIDLLLDTAKELSEITDLEFVIFGNGVRKEELLCRVENEKITNVKIFPNQPADKVPAVYSFGDVEYASVSPGVMKMACPHKLLDIFSVGRPVLAVLDRDSDMAEAIEENGLGKVAQPDVASLKEAILYLYQNREESEQMGDRARAFAEQRDYDTQISQYVDLIKKL